MSSGAAIAARLESYRFRSGPTAAPEPMTSRRPRRVPGRDRRRSAARRVGARDAVTDLRGAYARTGGHRGGGRFRSRRERGADRDSIRGRVHGADGAGACAATGGGQRRCRGVDLGAQRCRFRSGTAVRHRLPRWRQHLHDRGAGPGWRVLDSGAGRVGQPGARAPGAHPGDQGDRHERCSWASRRSPENALFPTPRLVAGRRRSRACARAGATRSSRPTVRLDLPVAS